MLITYILMPHDSFQRTFTAGLYAERRHDHLLWQASILLSQLDPR